MAQGTGIEWTESTWNPVTGCTKLSPGCKYCYAERMAERLQAMGQENYRNGFSLTLQPQMLDAPLRWRKPQTIFVNSMSDLFHRDVPVDYILRVFEVMHRAHWHRLRVRDCLDGLPFDLHAIGIEKEHRPVGTPVLLAQFLDFDVGVSSADLNATREVLKFQFERLKLCRSRRATLNKHVAIKLRLCLQGQTRGPVKEFLGLLLGQIGQQQCLRRVLVVPSPSITISCARESVDVTFFERLLLRWFVLQCRCVAAKIFGDQLEFRSRPTPAELMAFPGCVRVSSRVHADSLPETTPPASPWPALRALEALTRYERIKPTTTP